MFKYILKSHIVLDIRKIKMYYLKERDSVSITGKAMQLFVGAAGIRRTFSELPVSRSQKSKMHKTERRRIYPTAKTLSRKYMYIKKRRSQ